MDKLKTMLMDYDNGLITFDELFDKVVFIECDILAELVEVQKQYIEDLQKAHNLKMPDLIIRASMIYNINRKKIWDSVILGKK